MPGAPPAISDILRNAGGGDTVQATMPHPSPASKTQGLCCNSPWEEGAAAPGAEWTTSPRNMGHHAAARVPKLQGCETTPRPRVPGLSPRGGVVPEKPPQRKGMNCLPGREGRLGKEFTHNCV